MVALQGRLGQGVPGVEHGGWEPRHPLRTSMEMEIPTPHCPIDIIPALSISALYRTSPYRPRVPPRHAPPPPVPPPPRPPPRTSRYTVTSMLTMSPSLSTRESGMPWQMHSFTEVHTLLGKRP